MNGDDHEQFTGLTGREAAAVLASRGHEVVMLTYDDTEHEQGFGATTMTELLCDHGWLSPNQEKPGMYDMEVQHHVMAAIDSPNQVVWLAYDIIAGHTVVPLTNPPNIPWTGR